MFRGVILGRNWPETGMTSKKWLKIEPEWINYDDLIATQEGVYFGALMDETTPPVGGDPIIHVVRWSGQMFLEDGHTRVMRNFLHGYHTGLARVLNLS